MIRGSSSNDIFHNVAVPPKCFLLVQNDQFLTRTSDC